MNNKKNIDDYFDDNFEVTYTGDLPSIPVGQNDYDDRYDDTDYLNDYETDDYYDETDRLMTMIMKKRILIMTAKDQPDGQNGEIPADVPIPLPKNWLLQSGILPALEVLPLRN